MKANIMKKGLLTAVLALALASVFALAACSSGASGSASASASSASSSASASSASASSAATAENVNIAVVQLADNDAFTEMATAFVDEMAAQGYVEGKNVTYDRLSAQGDASTLNSIAASVATGDYDLIVSIVTPATQAVVNAEPKCPVVFISVTNPVGAGIMSAMETPDKNATGTSNVIPVSEIFGLATTLTPDFKTVGLLYCSGEQNAVLTIEKTKEYLDSQSIPYVEQTVANSAEVQQAAQSLAEKSDLIYIPVDSTVQSAMPQVVEAATAAGIPVYGSDPVMVSSGALASVSVSNTQLGARSAQMAAKILQGAEVASIPAEALTDYQYVINGATADALSVKLPTGDNYKVIGK